MPTADQLKEAATTVASSALATAYSAVINASASGMTCSGATALGTDGNTADTDALISAVASAASMPMGAEIVLPTGRCEINQTINIPVNAPLRFTGAGIGLTTLEFWTPNGVRVPVGNGLVFNISDNANLTVDDFTIIRRLGANIGAPYVGTAITMAASSTSPQAGNVTATNLDIYPANGLSDSWNTGILETNIADPLINNVTVNMSGWANIPDPGAYVCSNGTTSTPCAIHTLPSPANQVVTPANLGFGVATGVALQGSGAGHFAIDSVVEGLTVNGGLVGLDLRQFQGAYVTDSKFASNVYGIRADSLGTVSELLSVDNSLFTVAAAGIYANGIGGMQITGNYIQSSGGSLTNMPAWSGVWINNGNNDTISGNNILGSGSSGVAQYGIWHSANGPDGFPVSITGNTIYSLSSPGSICLGNTATMTSISASGNTLYACTRLLDDMEGFNGYADNSFQSPDMYDNGSDNVQFSRGIIVGNGGNAGSIQLLNNFKQEFLVDGSGDVTANGTINAARSITANGAITGTSIISGGPLVMAGNSAHSAAQEVVGNFYFPFGNNPRTITLNAPSGGFPAFTGGLATIFGELTCSGNNTMISWHVDGHYTSNATTIVPGAFSATVENDADSQSLLKTLGGTYTITPIANPTTPGVEVAFGTGIFATFDCSAVLTQLVEN